MISGCALFESASIIPDQTPFSSGERSGNLSGNAQKTTQSRDKRKRNPLCFKEIPLYAKNYQKKFQIPEGFPESRKTSLFPLMPMHVLLVMFVVF